MIYHLGNKLLIDVKPNPSQPNNKVIILGITINKPIDTIKSKMIVKYYKLLSFDM